MSFESQLLSTVRGPMWRLTYGALVDPTAVSSGAQALADAVARIEVQLAERRRAGLNNADLDAAVAGLATVGAVCGRDGFGVMGMGQLAHAYRSLCAALETRLVVDAGRPR